MQASNESPPSRIRCEQALLAALHELGGSGRRTEIIELARRLGQFSADERALASPPSKPSYPSYLDYALSWALTTVRHAGVLENARRNHWALTSLGRRAA